MPVEGADRFAISLVLFNTEKEAQAYFKEFLMLGLRSARVQMRESLLDKAQLEVRGSAEALARQLPELLGGQANARITECPSGPGN